MAASHNFRVYFTPGILPVLLGNLQYRDESADYMTVTDACLTLFTYIGGNPNNGSYMSGVFGTGSYAYVEQTS